MSRFNGDPDTLQEASYKYLESVSKLTPEYCALEIALALEHYGAVRFTDLDSQFLASVQRSVKHLERQSPYIGQPAYVSSEYNILPDNTETTANGATRPRTMQYIGHVLGFRAGDYAYTDGTEHSGLAIVSKPNSIFGSWQIVTPIQLATVLPCCKN